MELDVHDLHDHDDSLMIAAQSCAAQRGRLKGARFRAHRRVGFSGWRGSRAGRTLDPGKASRTRDRGDIWVGARRGRAGHAAVVADIAAHAEPTSPPDRRPTSQDPRNRSACRAGPQGRCPRPTAVTRILTQPSNDKIRATEHTRCAQLRGSCLPGDGDRAGGAVRGTRSDAPKPRQEDALASRAAMRAKPARTSAGDGGAVGSTSSSSNSSSSSKSSSSSPSSESSTWLSGSSS